MNYGDIIGDAFRISWRNKFLWFFGLFVGGTGTNFAGNIPSTGGNFDGDDFQQTGASSVLAAQFGQGALDDAALIAGLVVLTVLVVLFFLAMNLIS